PAGRAADTDGLAEGSPARGSRVTAGTATLRGKRGRERRIGDAASRSAGGARRQPDLSALLPLLSATGSLAGPPRAPAAAPPPGGSGSLRERLAPPGAGRPSGRHVGLSAVPHGAKTYLAATLAAAGESE